MRPNGQVCRNPLPSWRNCSPAALSPRLGKSRKLTGTRRGAAALPALPALLQGWYTSQGPQSNHIYTGFTKARTGQWLHRIYSKQEKKKLSLLTSWNTPVRKRTGKVFSQADRDCRTTASITLLWEESPWVGESCPPQFCLFQHEKQSMPSLPTAREAQGPCICSPPIPKANSNQEVTSVSLQGPASHLASSYMAFLLPETRQQVFVNNCKGRAAESWEEVPTASEFSHLCFRASSPNCFWNKAASVPSTALYQRSKCLLKFILRD